MWENEGKGSQSLTLSVWAPCMLRPWQVVQRPSLQPSLRARTHTVRFSCMDGSLEHRN